MRQELFTDDLAKEYALREGLLLELVVQWTMLTYEGDAHHCVGPAMLICLSRMELRYSIHFGCENEQSS